MELLHLGYFRTLARHQHVTRAAKELSIAQPALSQIIAKLEAEIGVPLFDRHGRQIRLNRYGKAFLRHVEEMFAALQNGLEEVAGLAGLEQGPISLAVLPFHILAELLKAFRLDHPAVRFRVHQQRTPQALLQQLQIGEIDLCITALPIEEHGIEWVPLLEDEIFLIVPADHPLSSRSSVALSEVAHETFISLKAGHMLRDLTDSYFQQIGAKPDIAFEIDEPSSVRSLVSAGLGISFSTMIGVQHLDRSTITPLRISEPACRRTIALAWKAGRYHSRASETFRQFVIDFFARLALDADRCLR